MQDADADDGDWGKQESDLEVSMGPGLPPVLSPGLTRENVEIALKLEQKVSIYLVVKSNVFLLRERFMLMRNCICSMIA